MPAASEATGAGAPAAAQDDVAPEQLEITCGDISALAYQPTGDTLLGLGAALTAWDVSPFARAASRPMEEPGQELAVSDDTVVARCDTDAFCVLALPDLRLLRRLRCGPISGAPRRATAVTASPDGRWIAGQCVEGSGEMGGALSTCIWDGRTGRPVRCVESGQPSHHARAPAFRPERAAVAVPVRDGFQVLDAPTFSGGPTVPVDTMLDSRALGGWIGSGPFLVLSSFGSGEVFEPGGEEPLRAFEIEGVLVALGAPSPAGGFAVLYEELLVLYSAQAEVLARRSVAHTSGEIEWSFDGAFLAVEGSDDTGSGFDVYTRDDLRHVLSARSAEPHARCPVAWHPRDDVLAHSDGGDVRFRQISRPTETPTTENTPGRRED